MEEQRELNKRYDRTTAEQIKCYVKYCKENPDLPKYQSDKSSRSAPKHIQKLWTQLAEELNAMRGPTRDVRKWKLGFSQWRKSLRWRARRLKEEGISDSTLPAYSELVLHDGKPMRIKKPVKTELPKDTMNMSDEDEDSNEPTVDNDVESDVEYPFDAIFYPCDKMEQSSTQQSRSSTPVKINHHQDPSKSQNETCCCNKLMKSLQARDERLFTQQQSVITKLDETLLLMTRVLEKINDKLDKL